MKHLVVGWFAVLSMGMLAACDMQQPETSTNSALDAQRTFERADSNGDGTVSRTEASSIAGLDFGSADADGNQTLSVDEIELAMAQAAQPAQPRG